MTHRGEPTQAYDFDEENSNTSANPTFDSVLGARLSRRGLLRGGVATAGTAVGGQQLEGHMAHGVSSGPRGSGLRVMN